MKGGSGGTSVVSCYFNCSSNHEPKSNSSTFWEIHLFTFLPRGRGEDQHHYHVCTVHMTLTSEQPVSLAEHKNVNSLNHVLFHIVFVQIKLTE